MAVNPTEDKTLKGKVDAFMGDTSLYEKIFGEKQMDPAEAIVFQQADNILDKIPLTILILFVSASVFTLYHATTEFGILKGGCVVMSPLVFPVITSFKRFLHSNQATAGYFNLYPFLSIFWPICLAFEAF